jgi:hypothetical protein
MCTFNSRLKIIRMYAVSREKETKPATNMSLAKEKESRHIKRKKMIAAKGKAQLYVRASPSQRCIDDSNDMKKGQSKSKRWVQYVTNPRRIL